MSKSHRFIKVDKRLTLIAALAVVLALCLVCAVSCNSNPKLTEITAEYIGGTVETDGEIDRSYITVTAFFSNKTRKVVSDFTLDYDSSTAGQCVVLVTYSNLTQSQTCTFTVTVVEKSAQKPDPKPDPSATLDSITAVYRGANVNVGGALDKSDIVVIARYSDNTGKYVTDFAVSGFSSATAGEKEVTVSYTEDRVTKSCVVKVTVEESGQSQPDKTLTGVSAVYKGKSIRVGATLINENIAVTARYSDDTVDTVYNFSVGGFSSATAGECVVTVSYSEGGVTKQCLLTLTVIENDVEVIDYGDHGILQDDGSIKIANTAIVNDDLQIHFISFENKTSGDSVYIKAGDKDILIDAGSKSGCAPTIKRLIDKYCDDGKLEYVVATHAHEDHIAAFVGNGTNGILDVYECETIITYANKVTNSNLSNQFAAKCQALKENGTNVYTALECYNNQNYASRKFQLSQNIEMEILYNYYYDHTTTNENLYSVCLLINQYGEGYDHTNPNNPANEDYVNHYLFTGDLEEDGESRLVDNNNLPKCVLFKSGHHGSKTSSTTKLLQVITPKVICACSCAGDQYKFPHQEMLNRIAPYTQMFFMTNLHPGDSGDFALMNGDICVTSGANGVFVNCSNNNTLFKDTEWFKNNRDLPPEWEETSN